MNTAVHLTGEESLITRTITEWRRAGIPFVTIRLAMGDRCFDRVVVSSRAIVEAWTKPYHHSDEGTHFHTLIRARDVDLAILLSHVAIRVMKRR